MQSCKRYQKFQTTKPPCCVQYYPDNKSIVFISTYKLEESGQKHGSVDIYKHDPEDLKLVWTTETSAVLDLKVVNSSTIATCHNTGEVILWEFDPDALKLCVLKSFAVFEDTATSVNYNASHNLLVATCTDGQTATIDMQSEQVSYFDTVHDLECWISAFGELGELSSVVFTGGDDGKLIAHDIRTSEHIWSTNTRHHEAGVVSILAPSSNWNTTNSNHLWTGSYDDNLRILDLRVIDKENPSLIQGYIPKVHRKENLGGGVWRMIPSPESGDNRVLVCCMYDGARIVDVKDDEFIVTKYFKEDHESMCYGGDWGDRGVVTCSFYDRVVQRWETK